MEEYEQQDMISYECRAAEDLHFCGRLILVLSSIMAVIYALVFIVALVKSHEYLDFWSYLFGAAFFAFLLRLALFCVVGFVAKCLLCGLAVLVESQFQARLKRQNTRF